jgi:hypothetical protein
MPCGVDTVCVRCECVYMSFVLTWFRARLCVPGPLARTAVPRRHSNTPRPARAAAYGVGDGTGQRGRGRKVRGTAARYLRARRARRPVRHARYASSGVIFVHTKGFTP